MSAWMRRASCGIAMLALCAPAVADVIYVRADAEPGGNGQSWATALRQVHEALATSQAGDEIWVARGTYTPAAPGGSRLATLQLVNRVAVYGGFVGTEERREQRDPRANPTVLSGDLNDDDLPDFGNRLDNSFHIVTAVACGPETVLDGFTVTAGYANDFFPDGQGAGLYLLGGEPTITGCVFVDNYAMDAGAGVFNSGSLAAFSDCTFAYNQADLGGGIVNVDEGAATYADCTFVANEATAGGGVVNWGGYWTQRFVRCQWVDNVATVARGGGLLSVLGARPGLDDCVFEGNHAEDGGGGMACFRAGSDVVDAVFHGNVAPNVRGGAVYAEIGDTQKFARCVFTANVGTAIHKRQGRLTLSECRFESNDYSAVYIPEWSDVTVSDTAFVANERALSARNGSSRFQRCQFSDHSVRAVDVGDAYVDFTDCTFMGNGDRLEGGAIRGSNARVTVLRCTLRGNRALGSGHGAAIYADQSELVLRESTLEDNVSAHAGGAVYINGGSTAVFGCLFRRNESLESSGGAVFCGPTTGTDITNCTILSNRAVQGGGVWLYSNDSIELNNCILWGNEDQQHNVEAAQVGFESRLNGRTVCNYDCIQGWTGTLPGIGSIGADPLLILGGHDNPRVQSGSPVIDAADNLALQQTDRVDLDGKPRKIDDPDTPDTGRGTAPIVDMGAYEFQPCADSARLKAVCRTSRNGVIVVAKARGADPGLVMTLRIDADGKRDARVTTNSAGRAKYRFQRLMEGRHSVEALECGLRASVNCP